MRCSACIPGDLFGLAEAAGEMAAVAGNASVRVWTRGWNQLLVQVVGDNTDPAGQFEGWLFASPGMRSFALRRGVQGPELPSPPPRDVGPLAFVRLPAGTPFEWDADTRQLMVTADVRIIRRASATSRGPARCYGVAVSEAPAAAAPVGRRLPHRSDDLNSVRVVTANVAGGRRSLSVSAFDYELDLDYWVDELRKTDADVILVQESEIDPETGWSTAKELAARLGYFVAEMTMCPSHMDRTKDLGIAILSRLPIEQESQVNLPSPGLEYWLRGKNLPEFNRSALGVRMCRLLDMGTQNPTPMHLFTDRLGLPDNYDLEPASTNAREMRRAWMTVDTSPNWLVIWGGDFNKTTLSARTGRSSREPACVRSTITRPGLFTTLLAP